MKLNYKAIQGDCIEQLPKIAMPDLIIADPPYNIDHPYADYKDLLPENHYLAWNQVWLKAAADALLPCGSMFVFYPDEWAADIDVFMRRQLGMHRRSWIVWSFGFGVANQKNFSRSHCHILYYVKDKKDFTFNADAIRVPSNRQLVYGDKRANAKGKLPDNTWVLTKDEMQATLLDDSDSWYISRICGTFKERKEHSPNQLPIALLNRIILSASNEGDLVVDPFAGTFSAGVASAYCRRNFIGIDVSKTCVERGEVAMREAVNQPVLRAEPRK